jgi:hypothetical protein
MHFKPSTDMYMRITYILDTYEFNQLKLIKFIQPNLKENFIYIYTHTHVGTVSGTV